MTTETVNLREMILNILLEVMEKGSYSHLVIRQVLDKYQYLEKNKRAFVTRVSEGTIQYCLQLDYIIDQFSKVKVKKMKPVIRNILRLSVYQMKYMDSIPDSAACNEAVLLARKRGFSSLSGFVNGVLREIGRKLPQISWPSGEEEPVKALSVCYSMPEWIVESWICQFGAEQTERILSGFLYEAPLTIRTNLTKITPDELERRLLSEGVSVRKLEEDKYPGLSFAFAVSGIDSIASLASFREGLFYVQDISSMTAVLCAGIKQGNYVIDVCAAPGGKSLHMAEILDGSGMVEARDLTTYKTALIEENISRCGLNNVKAVVWDASILNEDSIEKADVVLADLPCSGLGVLRKKTDIKYKMTKEKAGRLAKLQQDILDVICCYVKRGGTLIYSTCTISEEENGGNVRRFLEKHPQFQLQEERQMFPGTIGDGFYIAKFKKSY